MSIAAGMTVSLKVAREVSPYGYFLSDGNRDILLHYSETNGQEVKEGQDVEVFLYHDTEDRLSATLRQPLIRPGEVSLLEVVDIHPKFGCFLDMGIGRNLLLPYNEQPEFAELRPAVGDKVFIVPANDKQGRLLALPAGERDLSELAFHAPTAWKNQWLDARVYKPLQMGTFVIIEGGVLGFGAIGLIHAEERTRLLRLGERVQVRVTFVREDGRVNLSMRQLKQVGRDEDSDKILALLKERPNSAMPYSDATPADVIQSKFGISKSAFKRALGKLMKEGQVYQKENWTYLKTENSTSENTDSPE